MGEKCILAVAQIAFLYEHSDGAFWPRVSLAVYLGPSFTGVWTKYKRNRTFPEEIIIKFFTEAGSFPHLPQVTWEISFRNTKNSLVAFEPSDNGFTCDLLKPYLAFCSCRKILLFNTADPVRLYWLGSMHCYQGPGMRNSTGHLPLLSKQHRESAG